MKVLTSPVYYAPVAITSTISAQQQPGRIYYTPEIYGCIENFESSKDYNRYVDQIKYDLIVIANFLKLGDGVDENISFFCDRLRHHQNLEHDLKKLVCFNLGHCVNNIIQLTLRGIPADENTIRNLLFPVFNELMYGIRSVITNIICASSSIDGIQKNISWHIDNRRLKIIELELAQHVHCQHKIIDDGLRDQYIIAYKYHFITCKWVYSYLLKNKSPSRYIKNETEHYVINLLERLCQLLGIVNVIKDIGNIIRQKIREIINQPNHHEDIEGTRYLSECGHQAVLNFVQRANPPIDLNNVLARNIANNFLFMLNEADGIYGALADALAMEHHKEISYHITNVLIIGRSRVKLLEDFFWVDYDGRFKGPLTFNALRVLGAMGVLNDNLLRFAIINTPPKALLNEYHVGWCGNIHGVFNDYLQPNIYALYKRYINEDMVLAGDKDKNGNTFLHAVVFHNDLKAFHQIAHQQRDIINCKNNFGFTALMQAVNQDSIYMVRQLLACENIDINIVENHGFTASALAIEKNNRDILFLLNKHYTAIN